MILTCPSCRTRYRVAEEELVAGRTLRCASCGHSWEYGPAPSPPSRHAPSSRPPPSRPSMPALAPLLPAERRGHTAVTVLAVLLFFVAAAALGLYAGRNKLLALWPPAARLYALVAAPQPLGTGLKIGKITPVRTPVGLIVKGEITNTGKTARQVPALRIALRNAERKEVVFKIVTPPKARLLPGEAESFAAPFKNPPKAATGVFVTFAHD